MLRALRRRTMVLVAAAVTAALAIGVLGGCGKQKPAEKLQGTPRVEYDTLPGGAKELPAQKGALMQEKGKRGGGPDLPGAGGGGAGRGGASAE